MSSVVATKPGEFGEWNVIGERFLPMASGGAIEIFDVSAFEGMGPPSHRHAWAEAYHIVEGELQVTSGDLTLVAGPGSTVQIPGDTCTSIVC